MGCKPNSYGAFDPPTTLSRASAIAPPTTQPTTTPPIVSADPSPGGSLAIPLAPITSGDPQASADIFMPWNPPTDPSLQRVSGTASKKAAQQTAAAGLDSTHEDRNSKIC